MKKPAPKTGQVPADPHEVGVVSMTEPHIEMPQLSSPEVSAGIVDRRKQWNEILGILV